MLPPSRRPRSRSRPTVRSSATQPPTRSSRSRAKLQGARVLHVNATAFGGGVAEILATLIPLMNDIGLQRRLAGDQGRRRVLQRHEGDAQQPPGHVLRLDARDAGDLAQLQQAQRRPVRRVLRLRRHPRPAAGRHPDVPRGAHRHGATASGSGAAISTSPTRRCRCGTCCARTSRSTTRAIFTLPDYVKDDLKRPADLLRAAGDRPAEPEERRTARSRP